MGNSSSSTSKTDDYVSPVFLKAGIPLLALSVSGLLCAKIISTRHIKAKAGSMEDTKVTGLSSLESIDSQNKHFVYKASDRGFDNENHVLTNTQLMKSVQNSEFDDSKADSEDMTSTPSITNRIEELERKERDIESQLLQYHVIQEHESLLMEIKGLLTSEATHFELLNSKVSLMEAEKDRFEKFVREHIKVVKQLGLANFENGLLRRKVKKLLRKNNKASSVIGDKHLKIKRLEAEILRCFEDVEKRNREIDDWANQVRELKDTVNSLQEDKSELLVKLNSAANSASTSTKKEAEAISIEDCKQIVDSMEQLQKEREAETTELIHLRWTNACLRHELMRCHNQQQEQAEKKNQHSEPEQEGSREIVDNGFQQQHELVATTSSHKAGSKRKKLFQKLKKMVEGSEHVTKSNLEEKDKNEITCFRRSSVSDTEEESVLARMSCSSA